MLARMRPTSYIPLYRVMGLLGAYAAQALAVAPICHSSVYCGGDLLHRVQMARVFPDSKTFVDLRLIESENATLADFEALLNRTGNNPSRADLVRFVDTHFTEGAELERWSPPDFKPDPPVLQDIADPKLRDFAKDVISIWSGLGRRVSNEIVKEPTKYSFLYVPNGFIVPGGRFKEIYYWDSFWVVRGLLISGMVDTARGMIENLLHMVDTIGYIPNGSRLYYLGRSQPPLLAVMAANYYAVTGDLDWLTRNINTIERELQYWLDEKTVTVRMHKRKYILLRYLAQGKGPRPESYYEDYTNAQRLAEEARGDFYMEMKSAAESGWDFSTRWFVTADENIAGNLTDVHASRILPVDLNAIFAGALETVGDLRNKLKDRRSARKWWALARYWRGSIDAVLWNEKDGVWYDFDAKANAPRRHFYPSCVAPLWAGAVETYKMEKYASRLVRYLLESGGLDFPGGIPASLVHSGEQWDFPNAWPPLQSILIGGLEQSGYPEARKLAFEQAQLWIRANYIGYRNGSKMYEKYDALRPGREGEGGEYFVQDGFGWTNGVALELLQRYGRDLKLVDSV